MVGVVYINLDRDLARREAIEKAFAKSVFRLKRFPAICWRELTGSQQKRYYSAAINRTQYHLPLAAGECGCYASHIEVWRQIVDQNLPALIVLEDDVAPLSVQEYDRVIQGIESLKGDWDMIKLVGRQFEHPRHALRLTDQTNLIQYERLPSLTGAYAISRSGARKLLASRLPFARPIDVDIRLWWENDLAVFGAYPYPLKLTDVSHVSSIERQSHYSVAYRVAKLKFQFKYTVSVWRARRRAQKMWARLTGGSS